MLIEQDKCEAAVMSIYVGGAGLNCQTMNSIIFMAPSTSDYQIKQAKGNSFQSLLLTIYQAGSRDLVRKIPSQLGRRFNAGRKALMLYL